MNIKKLVIGDKLGIELEGRLDTMTAPSLDEAMANEVGDWKGVIVDLEKVEYISSAGLRVLLSIYKKYGSLEIKGANPTIKEVLSMTGMDSFFTSDILPHLN